MFLLALCVYLRLIHPITPSSLSVVLSPLNLLLDLTVVQCMVCSKTVYKMEEMRVQGQVIHRTCFRCHHCNKFLSMKGFAKEAGDLYCKEHYLELFKGEAVLEEFTPPADVVVEEEVPRINQVQMPANAMEAMKTKLATKDQSKEVVITVEATEEELKAGEIRHTAALKRVTMTAKRRNPKRQTLADKLPPVDVDKQNHPNSFKIAFDGSAFKGVVLWVYCTSTSEKNAWMETLGNACVLARMRAGLAVAQKQDMMAALQEQLLIDSFVEERLGHVRGIHAEAVYEEAGHVRGIHAKAVAKELEEEVGKGFAGWFRLRRGGLNKGKTKGLSWII